MTGTVQASGSPVGGVCVIGGAIFLSSVIALTGAAESEIPPVIGILGPLGMLAFPTPSFRALGALQWAKSHGWSPAFAP